MKFKFPLLLLMSFFSLCAYSQVIYFKGTLNGSQEVPPNLSSGRGTVIVKYDTASNIIELFGDYQNLSAPAIASHIHHGAPGSSGPVIIPLNNTGDSTGTLSGTATFPDSLEAELLAGNMYVNVHTDSFPAGEIKAQLTATTADQTILFAANLQGVQEVPPDTSHASGHVVVLLDKATGEVNLTGSFHGLTSNALASHIHRAPLGVSGPIIMPLLLSGDTSGTITGTDTLIASDISAMDSGHTYVNVHSDSFPAGEIRAQLISAQQVVFFKGTLEGSQEVPPNSSLAAGVVIAQYDTATNIIEVFGDYKNLSSIALASHIHQAQFGVSGPIIVPLTIAGTITGSIRGTDTLSDSAEQALLAGMMYVNVHSDSFPAGEIRAQLSLATPGQTDLLSGNLQGSQEVPPTSSTATGTVKALLDKGTDSVFVTGNYFGLTGPPIAAHIHRAPVGISGPVIVPLSASGSDTGAVSGTGLLAASDVIEMVNGNTYVNVHTDSFPAGEIRAQLGDVVLPVKLLYFNAFKDQNRVTLLWASAEEINFNRYEIEQQNPVSKQWIKKATIPGGNKQNSSEYRYSDLPLMYNYNFVFYRLKMIDKDGGISYSPVLRISYTQGKAELMVRPNPVSTNELQFIVTGLSGDKKLSYMIVDNSGRTVLTGTASSLMNNTLNIANFARGMYKLVVKFDNTVLQQSFIK
jgi:hypothetical protein